MRGKEPADNRIYFRRAVEIIGIPDDETVKLLVWTPDGTEPTKEVTVGWEENNRFDPVDIWLDYSENAMPRKKGAIGMMAFAAEFLVKHQIALRGPKLPIGLAVAAVP